MNLTIYQELYDALNGLVGGRVFSDVVPSKTALPHLLIEQQGGEMSEDICETIFLFEVSIDVSCKTASERDALIDSVHQVIADRGRLAELPTCFWNKDLDCFQGVMSYVFHREV